MTIFINQILKYKPGIESKVFLLCCLLSKNKAKANENQMQTKPIFLTGGDNNSSITSNPKIMPNMAPKLQKMTECHSSLIFIQKMVKAAAVIPEI